MRILTLLLAAALFVATASQVHAQDATYERLLIPVATHRAIPGGYGSQWITELVGRNSSETVVRVTQTPQANCGITCPLEQAQPRSNFKVEIYNPEPGTAIWLFAQRNGSEFVSWNLRAQDLSRQALTWGTELPVVRERDTFRSILNMLNVPTDDRFRVTLRIYDFFGRDGKRVRVRIFPVSNYGNTQSNEAPLVDQEFQLTSTFVEPLRPGFAQVNDLVGQFPLLRSVERVRIEVTPISNDLAFWAFATVTNNETQHLTTVLPSKPSASQ